MAIRHPWVLPTALGSLAAVLGLVVFGGAAAGSEAGQQAGTLRVPGNYDSIQAAIEAANPGDTIMVAPGTYHENIRLSKAVSLVAATFDEGNAANDLSILDGGNGEATVRIPNGVTPMPVVQGFVIRNSKEGIQARSPLTVENNFFYGSQTAVEYAIGAGGINRNNLYFNSRGDAVHVDDMAAPLMIQGNRFLYAGNDAIEIDLPGSSTPDPYVELDLWDNMLIGSSQDGIKFVDYASNPRDVNRRILIAGNLIANNRRAGIGFIAGGNANEDYSGTSAAESVRVFNNTLYGNDYGISGGGNLVVLNNIIANSTSMGAWRVQSGPAGNSVVAYTLFFNNRVDTDQTRLGPGNMTGQDPLFVAPPAPGPDRAWGNIDDEFNGLLLRPGSPAVDKGITQYKAVNREVVPPSPLTGYHGAAPDLGWRELGGQVFITPTPTVPVLEVGAATTLTAAGLGPSLVQGAATPGSAATGQTPSAGATAEASSTLTGTDGPRLTVLAVSPASTKSNSFVTLVIKGIGFQSGAVVSFEGEHEPPPQVTSTQVSDSTTLVANVDATDDSHDIDLWNVRVTNPDGTTAMLLSAFTISP